MEKIHALACRRDICLFKATWCVLRDKAFSDRSCIFLLGFLHVPYWLHCTGMMLALFLMHPVITEKNIWNPNMNDAVCQALKTVASQVFAFFKDLYIVKGELVSCVSSLRADRNPCNWNRRSSDDFDLMLADCKTGNWQKASDQLAQLLNRNVTFSYKAAQEILLKYDLTYYTGKLYSYQSVHFERNISWSSGKRCANLDSDWYVLCRMGNGVAKYGLDAHQARGMVQDIRRHTASSNYFFDDLCVLLCLAH